MGMVKIGYALGVDGFLPYDATVGIMQEHLRDREFKINLIGIKTLEDEYDILMLNKFKKNIDIQEAVESVRKNGILLLNSDEKKYSGIEYKKPLQIVTFGFNQKSSITMSSVQESDYLSVQCCIQRTVVDIEGREICPQEFCVNVHDENIDVYDALGIVSTAMLSGVDVEKAGGMFAIKSLSNH